MATKVPTKVLLTIENGIILFESSDGPVEVTVLDFDVEDLDHPLVGLDPVDGVPVFIYSFLNDEPVWSDEDQARFTLEGQSDELKAWIDEELG